MTLAKIILRFLLIFSVVYAVLITPQTKIGQAYAAFIRIDGQLLFGNFGKKGAVKFEPNFEEKNKWEYRNKLFLVNRQQLEKSQRTGSEYKMAKVYSSWYYNYLFVALLIALIAATPMTIKRKLWALFWGLVLIHIYINFGIYIMLLFKFNAHPYLDVVNLSGFGKSIVEFIYPIVMVNPGTGIFVAVIVWLIVCFRKNDLSNLIDKLTKPNKQGTIG